jgi:DNA primase
MQKSKLLYNFDNAASQPFAVIVEGVTSVWRLGGGAVCLFGKSMSMHQQNLIARTWVNKPVFLLLDNDAKAEMERARTVLTQHGMTVVSVDLPDARDPADYALGDITDLLMERAAAAGVLNAMI